MIHKLDLDESQAAELAVIIDELKTERAQVAVDGRRSVSSLAELIGSETFDEEAATRSATERAKSAARLAEAVVKALKRLHAVLTDEQRKKLAYLIRGGVLSI